MFLVVSSETSCHIQRREFNDHVENSFCHVAGIVLIVIALLYVLTHCDHLLSIFITTGHRLKILIAINLTIKKLILVNLTFNRKILMTEVKQTMPLCYHNKLFL